MTSEGLTRKIFLRLRRRQALAAMVIGLGGSRLALAQPRSDREEEEDLRNLRLFDLNEGGRRFLLIVPRYLQPEQRIPLVVFLHGLGETVDEKLGAYAWVDKYGLGSAWQRLKRAPIERTSTRGEWTDARLDEVNGELAARPFRGFALVCPFMPNPRGAAEVDAYAKWIETGLLPRVRKETRVFEDADRTYLCGVSLGGYVSLEVLVRLPHVFGAWCGLQTAIGTWAATGYAEKIAKAGKKPMLILTSTQDHWKASSEALAAELKSRNVPHAYRVIPGPHDQPWLREAGTIEAVHWLDRLYTPEK
jgi:pimeloyl-ACP methyl ester carboxylesterase